MSKDIKNVLTEEFLAELYNAAFDNDYLCSVICQYMQDEYLPDKQYQMLNNALKTFYREHKQAPRYGVIKQILSSSRAVSELFDDIKSMAVGADPDALRDQFENYLKLVRFKKIYKEIGKKYENGDGLSAILEFQDEARKLSQFTLAPDEFVDVAATFESRLNENRAKHEEDTKLKAVTRFYIDELDEKNHGRNLRTQLTIALAMSGVGKSHYARWVGANAAYNDGLNVLHFQLEGSASEVLDAYSASLVKARTFEYENGTMNSHLIEIFRKQMENYAGTLKVKAYPKFGKEVSTIDIHNGCDDYKKKYGYYPDVIIIDSLDLLSDSSGKSWDNKTLRFKRIAVAKDLKDIAADVNAWVFATYQATIEDPEWVNNEKNVLNGYNLSEAKGLQRPCTHLISLNQSVNEEKEHTMRLYVAKSRFFPKGSPFRICTDYEHEIFYDRGATLNLSKQS